ncbi:MAG: transcriptional regulator [Bacteroidetes bacterium]|nr:MAG: transcriptional regulator [Bacteroidota bacterium]PTM09792.1 MAG: transcriptional regulator [Bacteroidota bacterium]
MSNQTELRHFRYFLALAKTLHFRKAAEQLYISQPGLSRQIRQLEEHLGLALFERNNKTVTLTPAGSFLQRELSVVLTHLDEVLEQAKLISEGVLGAVKMGYVGSAMQEVIPRLLLQFKNELPDIHFSLQELDNRQQISALLAREIDLGFVRLGQVPAGLEIHPVWQETFALVVPQDHPLTVDNFREVSQLREEPFILFEETYSPAYYAQVMSIFADSGFAPTVAHNTVHANTIFRLVENHFGVSLVPSSLQLGYQFNVRFLELGAIPQRAVLSVAWNKHNRNPILQRVQQWLEEGSNIAR